ncbi:RNase P modulator RnpM [Alkaliphilus peptidifermentans]|uniref:YlxR domain-containing protein n=1 Tax=Alkaliphilus peptidifermentans DSM 18978 TaxID=1120976 RepID=A0A1G5DCH4_9FIRM|nr:YlxR family protein [Alkaliphilus peptidifermentans]SCY12529.1 hypothetical protein SAMN03080606_00870 [Alkaliphilus peptidifermentans DSM 18978]
MKTRKIPLRKCVGCSEMKPKKELIRVVKDKEGEIKVDLTGKAHGRGAYICLKKECFEKAKKAKALNRAFECSITDEVYEKLILEIDKGE